MLLVSFDFEKIDTMLFFIIKFVFGILNATVTRQSLTYKFEISITYNGCVDHLAKSITDIIYFLELSAFYTEAFEC